jgi:hypothetical protein
MTHLSKAERNRKITQAYAEDAARTLSQAKGVKQEFSAENFEALNEIRRVVSDYPTSCAWRVEAILKKILGPKG